MNSHALQTNQVALADDAYLTGKYYEENEQHVYHPPFFKFCHTSYSKADTCLLAEVYSMHMHGNSPS